MGLPQHHHKEGLTLNETTQLTSILQEYLHWHKSRIRFTAAFILALLRVRTVNFPSLALSLNPHAQQESNERRLQRFFSGFKLNLDAFAQLLLGLVPCQEKLVITLDRTHWQVGSVLWLAQRKPIRVKGHGRKARSVFRVGLDHLRGVLLNWPYRGKEFGRCLHALQIT